MSDWKEVAETIRLADERWGSGGPRPHMVAAQRLCELASKLPPGEAERVLEAAVEDQTRCLNCGQSDGTHRYASCEASE